MEYERKPVTSLVGKTIGGISRGIRGGWAIFDDAGNAIAVVVTDGLYDERGYFFEDDIDDSVEPYDHNA